MSQLSRCKLTRVRKTVEETVWRDVLTTICRSEDLTVPPLIGCCRWNLNEFNLFDTSCSWPTLSTLSSDHLPILFRLQMKTTSILGLCRTYVNLKKADWDRYRQEVETALSKRSLPTDCQRDEIFCTVLLKAASHHIGCDDKTR